MRKSKRFRVAWMSLRLMSAGERFGLALVIFAALAVVAAVVVQGYWVGDRIGRPGWICGHMIANGNPACVRDPKGGM